MTEPERPDHYTLPREPLDEGLETGEGVPFVLARGSRHAAGFDRAAARQDWVIPPHGDAVVGTGGAVAIPKRWLGLLSLRSGLGVKFGALCHIGIIDSDVRGEILGEVHNTRPEPRRLARGRRFAQPTRLHRGGDNSEPRRVGKVPETARGAGGFGSTGH